MWLCICICISIQPKFLSWIEGYCTYYVDCLGCSLRESCPSAPINARLKCHTCQSGRVWICTYHSFLQMCKFSFFPLNTHSTWRWETHVQHMQVIWWRLFVRLFVEYANISIWTIRILPFHPLKKQYARQVFLSIYGYSLKDYCHHSIYSDLANNFFIYYCFSVFGS